MSIPKIIVRKTPQVVTTTPRDDTQAAHATIQHIRTSLVEVTEQRSASATSRFRPTPLFAFGRSVPLAMATGGSGMQPVGSVPSPLPPSPRPQEHHHTIGSTYDVSSVQEQLLTATQHHVEKLTREKHELERQVMALIADAAQRSASSQQQQQHHEDEAPAHTPESWMLDQRTVASMRDAMNALIDATQGSGEVAEPSVPRDASQLRTMLTKMLQAHHGEVGMRGNEGGMVPVDSAFVEALVGMPRIAAVLVAHVRQASAKAAAATLAAAQANIDALEHDKRTFCTRLEVLIAQYESAHQQLRVDMDAERRKSRQLAEALAAATAAAQEQAARLHEEPPSVPAAAGSPLRRAEEDIAELAALVDQLQQHRTNAATVIAPAGTTAAASTRPTTQTTGNNFASQFNVTMQSLADVDVRTGDTLAQLASARKANIQRMLKVVSASHNDRVTTAVDRQPDEQQQADHVDHQRLAAQYDRQLEMLQERIGEADVRLQADRLAAQEAVERLQGELEAANLTNHQLQALVRRLQDQAMCDHDEMEDLQRQLEDLSGSSKGASPGPPTRIPVLALVPRIDATPPLILDPSELTWGFDVLGREAELSAAGGTLYQVGCAVATSADIFDDGAVDGDALKRLLLQLQRGYEDTPYHCVHHAADMTHAAFFMLRASGVLAAMDSVERAAALVACAGHDHQHPGRNNAFMIAVGDPVAARYNDQAVLENHHLASTWSLLERPEFNILARLAPQDVKRFRQCVVRIILNTDMAQHISHLAAFEARAATKPFDLGAAADRLELVCQLVHAADISGLARPFHVAEPWSHRVQAEFRAQGVEEAALGLPISFGCGPDVDVPASQVGFIDTFVAPLFRALARQFPQGLGPIAQTLADTRAEWALRCAKAPPPPPSTSTPTSIHATVPPVVNPAPLYDELSMLLRENIELREALQAVVAAVGEA